MFLAAVLLAQTTASWPEFQDRVGAYLKVRKAAAGKVPKLKAKATAEEIAVHKKSLAKAVRAARTGAQQGEIFTSSTERRIREITREEMKGSTGASAKKTAKTGNPAYEAAPPVHLQANGAYPDSAPVSTMPPALLLRLPELKPPLSFRFVGRDLVLLDSDAGIIVDFITDAIP